MTPVSSLYLREVLDGAVRCLAVSAAPVRHRLRASAAVLASLTAADFTFSEDEALFESIQDGLGGLGEWSDHKERHGFVDALVDADCERIAGEILDLRDTIMGRAIRDAHPVGDREGDVFGPR